MIGTLSQRTQILIAVVTGVAAVVIGISTDNLGLWVVIYCALVVSGTTWKGRGSAKAKADAEQVHEPRQ